MSAAVQLGGLDVLSLFLALPLLGVGTLEAEVDVDEDTPAPSGSMDLVFARAGAAPITFRVTVIEAVSRIGRSRVFAVVGAAGMRKVIAGLDYSDVSPALVAEDILSAADEVGDLNALAGLPNLDRWARVHEELGGPSTAQTQLTRLAKRIGASWRVGRDGRVRVAPETWPTYAPAQPPLFTQEPDDNGIAELALDAPDLEPGMTLARPSTQATGDSYRVSEVIYTLSEEGAFRARIALQLPEGGDGRRIEQWRRAVRSALPPLSLFVPHLATVVDQDDAGNVGLRLDGPSPPSLTLAAVPLYPGLPGQVVRVPLGAQCLVEFAGGREDAPVVRSWRQGAHFNSIAMSGTSAAASKAAVRVGDGGAGGTLVFVSAPLSLTITYTDPSGVPQAPVVLSFAPTPPSSTGTISLATKATGGSPEVFLR